MRYRFLPAALVVAVLAACSDVPTSAPIRPFQSTVGVTLEDFIQGAIDTYLPKGFESAVEARWATVKRKKTDGDMTGAVGEFNRLSAWITKKTGDITIPSGDPKTKEQAAALIILNMGRWLYEGQDADPLAVPTGDVAVAVVPAGEPLELVVPSKHASVVWDAGATLEERVVVMIEDPSAFPAQCQGPLDTRRCQYPLFFKIESFPDVALQTPGRVAVCMLTTGDRRPIEYPQDDPFPETQPHGPVGERMRLAHNLPANEADRLPSGIAEDGIEILPLSEDQTGPADCNAPSTIGMGPLEKGLYLAANFVGKLIAPKNAYAFDLGPQHDFRFFSNFNAVDPYSAPDLGIASLSGPATADPGAAITVSFRVTNRSRRSGAGDASARSGASEVTLYLSADATLDGQDQVIATQQVAPLWPGDSTDVMTQNVTLPESPADYFVLAQVNQDEGSLDECEPTADVEFPRCWTANNTATHLVTVNRASDPVLALFGVESSSDGLSAIDPVSGLSTFIARLSENVEQWLTPVAMTTDPTSGTLYAWNNSGPVGVLLAVNQCSGRATQIGEAATGVVSGALAASREGQLYLLGQPPNFGTLYQVNKTTGTLTAVGPLSINAFAAEFDPQTGTLYALSSDGVLYTVSTETGAATLVAQLSQAVGTPGSIVFTPTGTLLGTSIDGTLFDIDKATGTVSNIRQGGGGAQGLGFAAACDIIR